MAPLSEFNNMQCKACYSWNPKGLNFCQFCGMYQGGNGSTTLSPNHNNNPALQGKNGWNNSHTQGKGYGKGSNYHGNQFSKGYGKGKGTVSQLVAYWGNPGAQQGTSKGNAGKQVRFSPNVSGVAGKVNYWNRNGKAGLAEMGDKGGGHTPSKQQQKPQGEESEMDVGEGEDELTSIKREMEGIDSLLPHVKSTAGPTSAKYVAELEARLAELRVKRSEHVDPSVRVKRFKLQVTKLEEAIKASLEAEHELQTQRAIKVSKVEMFSKLIAELETSTSPPPPPSS